VTISTKDVKDIYETKKADSQIEPFLNAAVLVVTEELADAGLSSERLDLITKYLCVHYLVISEERGGIRRARLGDADESYVAPSDKFGLASTTWGQQAIALDTTGTLAQLGGQQATNLKAEFRTV
jgi:hypothetical protein